MRKFLAFLLVLLIFLAIVREAPENAVALTGVLAGILGSYLATNYAAKRASAPQIKIISADEDEKELSKYEKN